MIRALLVVFVVFMAWFSEPQVRAQTLPGASGDKPLEITADASLEWRRGEQRFIARKNALAVQGDASVAGQTLTAHYRDGAGTDLEIYKVEAEGGVQVSSRDSTAYGDHGTYDLDTGLAVLTGQNLRMVSPDQTITAQERFEYQVSTGRVVAVGQPKVIRPKPDGSGTDTLESNELVATLKDNKDGQRVIDTIEATGNVLITTPTEVVTGAYGIYKAATNKAELTGGVTITRGPNVLEGEKAVVDLNTNTSQMFGSQLPGGRVRGVFYPGSEKKKEKKKQEQEPPTEQDQGAAKILPPPPQHIAGPAIVSAPADIEPAAGEIEVAPFAANQPQHIPNPAPIDASILNNIEPTAGEDAAAKAGRAPLTRP